MKNYPLRINTIQLNHGQKKKQMEGLEVHLKKGLFFYILRCTFIDDIFKEAKVRGNPGSGKYNVIPTLEEVLK